MVIDRIAAPDLAPAEALRPKDLSASQIPLAGEWTPVVASRADVSDTDGYREPPPATLVVSFRLPPRPGGAWLTAWTQVGRAATARPACRDFRFLTDRSDTARCVVVSTWRDVNSLNLFAREMGFTWIERAMAAALVPVTFTVLESLQQPSEEAALYSESLTAPAL